ncbi:DUF5684 domain-containing protein [Microbacterium sp. 1P10UB]|uniref:DUF5684 domain-containing protein n=1 Tax=unclassified Microbacterium TaxID=2609290 RepID=UPI0039A13C2D
MLSLSLALPLLASIQNTDTSGSTTGSIVGGLIGYIFFVAAVWPFLKKAGQPGWVALIPVVAAFFIVRAAGLLAWWGLLLFVPLVNIVFAVIVALRLGRAFGHGAVFSIFLLWLLSLIGYFILSYSGDRWDRSRI